MQTAIEDVTIDVERGRFVTLLGPSGSGKTTILMSVAGFVPPTSGEILLDGNAITQLPPEQRNFGMVFQGYALFPHMTVEENIWFPLRVRRIGLAGARKAIRTVLELVQMRRTRSACRPSCRAASSSAWRSPAHSSSNPT